MSLIDISLLVLAAATCLINGIALLKTINFFNFDRVELITLILAIINFISALALPVIGILLYKHIIPKLF